MASPLAIVIITPLLFVYCLPGFIWRQFFGNPRASNPLLELTQPLALGYFLSTAMGTLALLAGIRDRRMLLLLPLLWLLVYPVVKLLPGNRPTLRSRIVLQPKIVIGTGLVLLITLSPTILPLARIGYQFPEGNAYRAYFNVDYLKHLAVTNHLAHSSIPPDNPYLLNDEPFHYYWLFYLFPASVKALVGPMLETVDIVRLVTHWINVIFVILLLGILQNLTPSFRSAGCVVVCGLTAYSYEGVYVIGKVIAQHKPFMMGIAEYNVDAATRWFIGHPQVDGLYRTLIYTPQHLFALCLMSLVILAMIHSYRARNFNSLTILGYSLLTASIFGFSSFIGTVANLWWWLMLAWHGLRRRTIRKLLAAALPFLLVNFGFWRLGILFSRPGSLVFAPQTEAMLAAPLFLLLNFGPLILLAPWGVWVSYHTQRTACLSLVVLSLICFGLMFGFQIQGFPSDMGLKLGLIVTLTLMLLSVNTVTKRSTALFIAPLILTALPTVLIDAFNSSDITNARFTTLVEAEDLLACAWIERHLPAAAVIQSEPFTRGAAYSLIPTFAGRRTALGDAMHAKIFLGDEQVFTARSAAVDSLFRSTDPAVMQSLMTATGIDFVLIGAPERRSYGSGVLAFTNFVKVYDHHNVQIYANKLLAEVTISDSSLIQAVPEQEQFFGLTITNLDSKSHSFRVRSALLDRYGHSVAPIAEADCQLTSRQTAEQSLAVNLPNHLESSSYTIRFEVFHLEDSHDRDLAEPDLSSLHQRFHTTGALREDASRKYVLATADHHPPGILLEGPLGILPEGQYRLGLVKATGVSQTGVARVTVTRNEGRHVIASKVVKTGEFDGPAAELNFTIDQPRYLTVSVRYEGEGTVGFSGIELHWQATKPSSTPLAVIHRSLTITGNDAIDGDGTSSR